MDIHTRGLEVFNWDGEKYDKWLNTYCTELQNFPIALEDEELLDAIENGQRNI